MKLLSLTLLLIPALAFATQSTPGEFDRSGQPCSSTLSQSLDTFQVDAYDASNPAAVIPPGDKEIVGHLETFLGISTADSLLDLDYNWLLAWFPDEDYLKKTEDLLKKNVELGTFRSVQGGVAIQTLLRLALHKGSDEMLQLITETFAPVIGLISHLDTRISPEPNVYFWQPLSLEKYFEYIFAHEIKHGRRLGQLLLYTSKADRSSVIYSMTKIMFKYFKENPKRKLLIQLRQFLADQPNQHAIARGQIQDAARPHMINDLANIVADYAIAPIPADVVADIFAIPIPELQEIKEQPELQTQEQVRLARHRQQYSEEKKNQE